MARRATKDMSIEEFDAWCAARERNAAVAESADEDGGPRLSLGPVPDQQDAWPTDLLAPAAAAADHFPETCAAQGK